MNADTITADKVESLLAELDIFRNQLAALETDIFLEEITPEDASADLKEIRANIRGLMVEESE